MSEEIEDQFPPEEFNDDCEVCGEELQWEDCNDCEDGFHDAYEDDPLWYEPGDLKPCNTCDGKGGWYICWNYKNHPKEKE